MHGNITQFPLTFPEFYLSLHLFDEKMERFPGTRANLVQRAIGSNYNESQPSRKLTNNDCSARHFRERTFLQILLRGILYDSRERTERGETKGIAGCRRGASIQRARRPAIIE